MLVAESRCPGIGDRSRVLSLALEPQDVGQYLIAIRGVIEQEPQYAGRFGDLELVYAVIKRHRSAPSHALASES